MVVIGRSSFAWLVIGKNARHANGKPGVAWMKDENRMAMLSAWTQAVDA
jgi:hypothetical protein